MDGLSATDLQIFREKSRAFIGSVKIPLDKLQHEGLPENPRQLDEQNVSRLLGIFQSPEIGCQRRDPENHVPVLISRSALPSGPLGVDIDFQLFNPSHPLTFLHGRHRIEAARKFLTGNGRWWIADLYSDDLSLQVKHVLREHDPSCARFYDGDIFRQIRISTIQGDVVRREKFLARLSPSKQDYVKRLEGLSEQFCDSLDALIPFAGLWPAIQIGTFLRLSNLHCPEEMTRYLRRVKVTMVYIIGEDENAGLLFDANTAFLLQGLCPGLSLEDRAFIQMRMLSRDLFPAIKEDNTRSQILERICSIQYVIITIYTFLEDTKYLEPCAKILKKVLPGKSKGSLSQYFNALHNGQQKVNVQITESTFDDRTFSSSCAPWVAYRVLWLLALRHFPEMDGQAPRKDIGRRGTRKPGLQPQWWIELSRLALGNGYKRIRNLYRDRKEADSSEIEDCIRRIRPSMEPEVRRRKVQLIYQLLGDLECGETITGAPELTSDRETHRPNISDKCSRPDISYRCGRPHDSVLQADESCLFFDYIYSTSYDTAPKRYLTSFAITRDFFHSFFGTAEDDLDQTNFFRMPRDDHGGDRQGEEAMQDVENVEGPPVDQRPAPPPPSEVLLPPNLTRPVENMHSAAITPDTPPLRNERSPDRYRGFTPGDGSESSHRSGRRRERSNSTGRHDRRDSIVRPAVDTIFPEAVQQLVLVEKTQAAAGSSEDVSTEDMEVVPWEPLSAFPLVDNTCTAIAPRSRSLDGRHNIGHRGRSVSPLTHSHRSGRFDSIDRRRKQDSTRARGRDSRRRDTIFPGSIQQLLPVSQSIESTQPTTISEDVLIEDMEVVPWEPPSALPLVENTCTAIAPRSRSLDGRHNIGHRGRSASLATHSHRLKRLNSTNKQHKRDSTKAGTENSRIRDTIFPGSMQQLFPINQLIKSTQPATISEDVSIEDMDIELGDPPQGGESVIKARPAVASMSRSLDGRRRITQRGRSTSPTIGTRRSERRRERSTSHNRMRQRSGQPNTSSEDMEMIQWVPPPMTQNELLAQHSHSATISSASPVSATQPSTTPIFSQEIRDSTFRDITIPEFQLSTTPMLAFSEDTMSSMVFNQKAHRGNVSARKAAQPAATNMSMLEQTFVLPARQPIATPLLAFGPEGVAEEIIISLKDASRLISSRQTRNAARSFLALSLTSRNHFSVREADPTDTISMFNALQLPSKATTVTLAVTRDRYKRIKLVAPTTILEDARTQEIDMAIQVSSQDAGEIVRRLKDFEEESPELRRKKLQPSLTVDELGKRNGKPIQIAIWNEGEWQVAEKNVTHIRTEERVRFYMNHKRKGVRPYDLDGTSLAIENCFRGAQNDSPPKLYLCFPEEASSVFPIDL